jgi:HEAT repeat protein
VVETMLAPPEEAETLLSKLQDALAEQGVDPAVRKEAAVLIVGALAARANLRRLSIMALTRLKVEPAIPILVHAFHQDEATSVREEALSALVRLLGDRAEPYLEEAFEDNAPAVRKQAAFKTFYVSPQLLARMVPRLRKLLADPEESVRHQARVTLYRWEKLSKKAKEEPDGPAGAGVSPPAD